MKWAWEIDQNVEMKDEQIESEESEQMNTLWYYRSPSSVHGPTEIDSECLSRKNQC